MRLKAHIFPPLLLAAMDFLTALPFVAVMDGRSIKAALNAAIERIVRTEFADAAVHSVHVVEDSDADGDPILRVTVVFETAAKPDSRKVAGLVRHLWPALEAENSSAFPLIAFRSKADHDRVSETA